MAQPFSPNLVLHTQPLHSHDDVNAAPQGSRSFFSHQRLRKLMSMMILPISLMTMPVQSAQVTSTENQSRESQSSEIKSSTATGAGIGAVIGGVAAGPFGLIVGTFAGGLLGEGEGHKVVNNELNQTLATQAQQLTVLEDKLSRSQRELIAAQRTLAQRDVVVERHAPVDTFDVTPRVTPVAYQQATATPPTLSLSFQFRTGSIKIEPQYKPQLDQLAAAVKDQNNVHIQLTGFADRTGEKAKNLTLSKQRATAIKEYLIAQGVNHQSFSVNAVGEAQPLSVIHSLQNDFFDRRVVLVVGPKATEMTAKH